MTTQFKTKDLSLGPLRAIRPALGLVVGGAPVTRGALHDVISAQDTFATSGRRIVGVAHLHGNNRSEIPDATDPANAAHNYPYADNTNQSAYSVQRWLASWHIAPGHLLEQWAIVLPGGPTEEDPANTQNGTYGASIVEPYEATDDALTPYGPISASSVAAHAASTLQFAQAPTSNSPRMLRIGFSRASVYTPAVSKAEQSALSESPAVFAHVLRYGAPRLHSVTVAERPRLYVRQHSADWTKASLHAYTAKPTYPDTIARTKYPDGTFDEPRYGLSQAYDTAVRQANAQGPVLFCAIFDLPSSRDPEDGILGIQVAAHGTNYVSVLDSSKITWEATEPGWPMAGYFAGPQATASHEASHGGAACVIPVRVTVYYSPANHDHSLRVMTSPRSFVDVFLDKDDVWASACGYLECQRSAEDWEPALGGPVAQIFADTGSAALTIRSVTVEYGHLPWAKPTLTPG